MKKAERKQENVYIYINSSICIILLGLKNFYYNVMLVLLTIAIFFNAFLTSKQKVITVEILL